MHVMELESGPSVFPPMEEERLRYAAASEHGARSKSGSGCGNFGLR